MSNSPSAMRDRQLHAESQFCDHGHSTVEYCHECATRMKAWIRDRDAIAVIHVEALIATGELTPASVRAALELALDDGYRLGFARRGK